ncbi:MAG TPA: hypothetical protein VFG12_15545 [Rhodopila sp.]|jgi:hypothetical protein|nr:hypothetical protein [Rhodopila sp.]
MRRFVPLLGLLLAGCGIDANLGAFIGSAGTVGTIMAIQRTPWDAAYSLVTGRDCSMVRLDRGQSYCRPVEPPPGPQPYCTRTLGTVNCWQGPAGMPNAPPGLADGPATLTAEQEADRVRRWP